MAKCSLEKLEVISLILILLIPALIVTIRPITIDIMTNDTGTDIGPIANPVAPLSSDIHYSGDPGDGYTPEPQLSPVGPQTLIVLLVYFSDLAATESVPTFNSLIFGNVSDYYEEISYGQCSLSGTVAGWYNLGNTKAYYGADGATSGVTDDTDDDGDNDSWRLVDDAIAAADPVIDFSSYGHIMVVHAGNGQESSGVSTDIWSVRWSWPGHFVTDEKTFDSCSIVPEHQGGDVDRCIGVIAHEFGHDIGLPDLYHFGKSGSDDLVGIWGLMASGSWGGSPSGTRPTHMTAYCKLMLDWYGNDEIYDLMSGSFEGTLTASYNQTSGLRVIRYNVTESYYYLVEARYRLGYDSSLSQSGIIVTRVDTTKGSGQGIVQVRSDWIYSLSFGSWTPGEEFVDEVSGFAVEILSQEGTSFRVRVTSDPLDGWLDEKQLSGSGYTDYRSPVMTTNSLGTVYCAYMKWDTDLGHYTISVRTSDDGGYSWSYAFGFYSVSMSYINPSIAIDPYNDRIYIAYERTDGLNHNIGLARYFANHSLWAFSTIATDARNPSITAEYRLSSGNDLMLAYEKWTGESSSVINVDRSTDHGDTWITQSVHSIETFSIDPEIVGSYGYDGVQRWHMIYIEGNDPSNLTRVIVSRSSDYFAGHSGWTSVWFCTISHPTVAAVRGSPEVFYAWTVNRLETTPSYQHDIYMWYSTDHGDTINGKSTLYSTTDDEKYPKLAADSQDYPTYEKGLVYLTYFNGDDVCLRRIYYDRPSIWGEEEILSTSGYDYPDSIGISTHYVSKHFYPVVSWLNNTSSHEIVCAVPGYTKEFGVSSPGYEVYVDGILYTCPFSLELVFGYTYSFTTPDYFYVSTHERLRFDHWEGVPAGHSFEFQNFILTVDRFDTGYDLLTVTQYEWMVEFVGDVVYTNSGWLDAGTNTTFWATAGGSNETTRFVFSHWSGNVSGIDNMESSWIIMTGPVWAYAHWTTQYYVTVVTPHSSSPSTGWYNKSLVISVSISDEHVNITSDSRWLFDYWSGNTTGSDYAGSIPFTIDGPKTIYANWQLQYLVTGLTVGRDWPIRYWWFDEGAGTTFMWDSNVSVVVDSQERLVFSHWGGNVTGSDYTESSLLVVDGPKTVYSYWMTQYYLTVVSSDWDGYITGMGWYNDSLIVYLSLDNDHVNTSTGVRRFFLSWGSGASGTDYQQSDDIIMSSYREVVVNDVVQYLITVLSEQGDIEGATWIDHLNRFSVEVPRVIDIVSGESRWYCRGSTVDDQDMTTDANVTFSAVSMPHAMEFHWVKQHYLAITTVPSGLSGTDDLLDQAEWFDENAVVSVIAVQVTGYTLHEWLLDGLTHPGTNTTTSVTMDNPHVLSCVYVAASTTPTSTTDTSALPPPPMDASMIILILGGVGAAVAVIVILVVMKKKKG